MIKSKLLALLMLLSPLFSQAQVVKSFEGIDASQDPWAQHDVDPNGAIGTKQYMEWTNITFQAYDKVTFAPVWSSPQYGASPWKNNGMPCNIAGDGVIIFDRQASRWVIGGHNSPGVQGPYNYCVAVSNTDDLTSATLQWYTYRFQLNTGANTQGHPYFPDWPKLGTWADGYYVGFDLMDVDQAYRIIGVMACAMDRTNMLTGATPNPIQCFSDPNPIPLSGAPYLRHSLVPADIDGKTAPPAGRDEIFVSIQNPPRDGTSTTSNSINLWEFHVDWVDPANSTFTNSSLTVPTYTPGCYTPGRPTNTYCVIEPALHPAGGHYLIDSMGDRLMPRLAYRNFGTYESFLISHTVQVGVTSRVTGIRWYELRGSGTPALFQSGTVSPDITISRFMPSIAQDHSGHAAVGFSLANAKNHPSIHGAWWNLATNSKPIGLTIQTGTGDQENSQNWGDYSSMTVDPVDDCTFWYVNEYMQTNEIGNAISWNTRIGNFKLSSCTPPK
jgi:hypothetical protein